MDPNQPVFAFDLGQHNRAVLNSIRFHHGLSTEEARRYCRAVATAITVGLFVAFGGIPFRYPSYETVTIGGILAMIPLGK